MTLRFYKETKDLLEKAAVEKLKRSSSLSEYAERALLAQAKKDGVKWARSYPGDQVIAWATVRYNDAKEEHTQRLVASGSCRIDPAKAAGTLIGNGHT